jgi:exodeoxyribonuclease VII large subunit
MYTDGYQRPALSVSELNREAKNLLEGHFDWVTVEGEIGNFTAASSGHWYFSLKDADAQVRCAMFRRANGRVKSRPAQGDSVRIRAKVSLYEGRGEFQLICEHLEPAGAGALQLAFDQLKKRLSEEGLFAQEAKRAIPQDAAHVGVITSPTGAVLQDILTVLARRSPQTRVYVFPVPVQGDGAAELIAAAIGQANHMSETGALPLDVLIVGRGGGSLEDLWAFNEEIVARALFAATVPIVSAVGHEVDFSIADLAADSRAATPSAAAEMISNDQNELLQHLDLLTASMTRSVKRQLDDTRQRLASLSRRVRHPGHALGQQRATLDRLSAALSRGIARQLADSKAQVARLSARVKTQHPRQQLNRHQLTSQQLQHQLRQRIDRRLTATRAELNHQSKLLASLGPEQTLSRGYAIVTDEQGKVVRQAASTDKGDQVRLRLGSGVLSAEITGHPTE